MSKKNKGAKGTKPIVYKKNKSNSKSVEIGDGQKASSVSWNIRIELLSPIHLGGGGADVNTDMEVTHDATGLPYFPAKRFKGLLYESALEVAEMAELSDGFLSRATVEELFQHGQYLGEEKEDAESEMEASEAKVQMVVHDFLLGGEKLGMRMRENWAYLEDKFKEIVLPSDVLELYTELRFFTSIDTDTGAAADQSLHNMRVVTRTAPGFGKTYGLGEPPDFGNIFFSGTVELRNASAKHKQVFLLALANLRRAGMKRNRGMGRIRCCIEGKEIPVQELLERRAN